MDTAEAGEPNTPEPANCGDAPREAWLWSPPEKPYVDLPVTPELESLPLEKLAHRDAERLFLCLLERQCNVTYAKSYGLPGQEQEGIDVYARLRDTPRPSVRGTEPEASDSGREPGGVALDGSAPPTLPLRTPRRHVVLQSKRVSDVYPSTLKDAVTKFLDGPWPITAQTFIFATTFDFRERNLDQAVRDATDRLERVGVEFVPWDLERINELLRDEPRLVERFFGRHAVGPFCGEHRVQTLANHTLDDHEVQWLRTELARLYQASFAAVASIPPARPGQASYVMLDVLPQTDAREQWLTIAGVTDENTGLGAQSPDNTGPDADASGAHPMRMQLARPRRQLRSAKALLEAPGERNAASGAEPADSWMAGGTRNLLVGSPGAGKSSLLRFVATDLLAPNPTSVDLQRALGNSLPVWLPFGHLCAHLDADHENSLVSAISAWLSGQGRGDLTPLVTKALEDDRLLLLVDGIDEWTSEGTANKALGAIETFLGHTNSTIVVTSRPYALSRLPFNLDWSRATLAALDQARQRLIAEQYLVPPPATDDPSTEPSALTYPAGPGSNRETSGEGARGSWLATNIDPFLRQVAMVVELRYFARTPLLLALLAKSWRGRPLPTRRFDAYNLIVHMLVDTHPKMRARASTVSGQTLDERDFLTALQAVAYRIKADLIPQPMAARAMERLLRDAFQDEDVLDLDEGSARTIAGAALEMAEDEFGLLVPQGARQVSFVHRVIGDHLAGLHLAGLEVVDQLATFAARYDDPAWTDVLLAALSAQTNQHQTADLLDHVFTVTGDPAETPAEDVSSLGQSWPQADLKRHAALRFASAAMAADIKLPPRKAKGFLDQLVHAVERSTSLELRDVLLTALAGSSATDAHWLHLSPTFRRWLNATRFEPRSAMWALRETPPGDHDRIRDILLTGFDHDDGTVRANAVEAYAARFGETSEHSASTATYLAPLLGVLRDGPEVRTQAAALMAMVVGWPSHAATSEALEWARTEPRTNLRTVALHSLAARNPDVPLTDLFDHDEYASVMQYLDSEAYIPDHSWTGLDADLVTRAVAESDQSQRDAFAEFAVNTLRQNPMTGGNRSMCWNLACGPLAEYAVLRDWAVRELADETNKYPLSLYNLAQMPTAWTDDPALKQVLVQRAPVIFAGFHGGSPQLTRVLLDEQARTVLLDALDGFRSTGYAQELLERFPTDLHVQAELESRMADDKQAAKFAGVAIDILGAERGFERIFSLLCALNDTQPRSASEDHVLLGLAVAFGWSRLAEAANKQATNPEMAASEAVVSGVRDLDPAQAATVLAKYRAEAVAAAAMAIPNNGLGWHVPDVIHAWPEFAVDYALDELRSDRHIMSGVPDPIHALALRTYGSLHTSRSAEVVNLALDLMTPLPATLREVLTYELAAAPISAARLVEALSVWRSDPDDSVRTIAAVGITQSLLRESPTPEDRQTELYQHWRSEVRDRLVAYGQHMDADRQIAWTCMLLLDEPELLDGLVETIGDPIAPGVDLTDLEGQANELLVQLIAVRWPNLKEHLGPNPLERLTRRDRKPDKDPTRVLQALMRAGADTPFIEALSNDPEGCYDRSLEAVLKTSTSGVDALIARDGHSLHTLQRVLQVTDGVEGVNTGNIRERWMLTRLLETWDVASEQMHQLLADASEADPPHPHIRRHDVSTGAVARATLALVDPQNQLAQTQYADLASWFSIPADKRSEGPSVTWLEAIAVTVMCSPAEQLPVLWQRLLDPRRLEIANEPMWKFTLPMLRRLSYDSTARVALSEALAGAPDTTRADGGEDTLTLFETSPRQHDPVRLVFASACALKASGHLDEASLETALKSLRQGDARTAVVNPFSSEIGPLSLLGAKLIDHQVLRF